MSRSNSTICSYCEGRGNVSGKRCLFCDGTGVIDFDSPAYPACPQCKGSGSCLESKYTGGPYTPKQCTKCGGVGRILMRMGTIKPDTKARELGRDIRKISARYDLIEPNFLEALAQLMSKGAEKHGDYGYKDPNLQGGPTFINHLLQHLQEYRQDIPHDHTNTKKTHLIAIAANAMMEYYHCERMERDSLGPIEDSDKSL